MKFIALATVLAATIAVASASLPVQPESFVLSQEDQHQHIINHKPVFIDTLKSYIVVFKESTEARVIEKAEKDILDLGGKIVQRYNSVFKGFAALMPSPLIQALSTNPFIDYIEEDTPVTAYN
ncbi:hypothetical protein B0O80DRAFT_79515 [Mortierella sp. GBAus27b]|nr:hypothetical protein BGX31_002778 [Mortierella sp. GBA43]KAI8352629.1 hypothetical protein B0O80DRAFT_79515 [Mortierella sp. GBAus27b]